MARAAASERGKVGVLACLLVIGLSLSGCVSSGGVSVLDSFSRSPEGQTLMNEAIDRFVEKLDFEMVRGKTVRIVLGEFSSGSGPNVDVSETVGGAISGVGWSRYLKPALERKISSLGGRLTGTPDLQLIPTVNAAGLRRRTVYVNSIVLFSNDLFHVRSYWAEFDATVDIKTGDGSQIVKTQRQKTESSGTRKIRFFPMSELFD